MMRLRLVYPYKDVIGLGEAGVSVIIPTHITKHPTLVLALVHCAHKTVFDSAEHDDFTHTCRSSSEQGKIE